MLVKKWKTLESHVLFKSNYAEFRREVCEFEDGRIMPNYYILDVRDWVNIVAITREQKIILVRQYRHAAKNVTLEIPGGAIDRNGESPVAAARRELLEETGFAVGELLFESSHYPNPALQSNQLWTYVFKDCVQVAEPDWDEFEEMEIHLVSLDELKEKVYNGHITHSLILASLFIAWPAIEKHAGV
jgi:8-oxo-dGTP pyrophosphatase MutT (NUDIX family)